MQISAGDSGDVKKTSAPLSPSDKDVAKNEELAKARAQLRCYANLVKRLKKALFPKATSRPQEEADKEIAPPSEDLIRTELAELHEKEETLRVPLAARLAFFPHQGGLHSSYDETVRQDLRLVITRTTLRVETLTDLATGRSLRADTTEFGPERSKLTWTGLALIARLAVEYALPIERMAKMFGKDALSESQLFRWLYQLAKALLPIYLYLAEAMAEASYLSCDDSQTKVIEMQKKMAAGVFGSEKDEDLDPLVLATAQELGRVYDRKDKKGVLKSKLQVSFFCGKEVENDPRSYIFFFRTHFGSCGNLLSTLLSMRRRDNKKLTVQGDLSTTNFASALYYQLFDLTHVGCGAHARRDVWRYKDEDEELFGYLLRAFALLSHVERTIDQRGRTVERTLHYRKKYAEKLWRLIYLRCKEVVTHKAKLHWPKTSKPYEACHYIVKHYESGELTAYLSDARLAFTNNLCERMLRSEKMLLVSCKFRQTERGRVVFDILRTMVTTCAAADVKLADYFKWVMQNSEAVANNPSGYTPYAFAKTRDLTELAA